jgi:hypothetical protein
LLLGGILSGCNTVKPGSYDLSAAWCQETADKVKALQPVDIPGSLAQDDGLKTGNEFDVNDYFSVLKHMSMNGGYVLDYIYFMNDSGATPILYTRHKGQEPYANYYEIGKAGSMITRPENDISLVWLVKGDKGVEYGSQIKIDKSSEGYFEYTVLQIVGGQFYLFYKANVYDVRIVCEPAVVEGILNEIDNSEMTPIDDNFKTSARSLDLQPTITVSEDTVTVSLVIFTKWGGFFRAEYTMNRDYPNSITQYSNEKLLEYNCGITL